MIINFLSSGKKTFIFFILALYIIISSSFASAQIKIFERQESAPINNKGLFPDSPSRVKIDLNGEWQVSFNNGERFDKFKIPCSYDYEGNVIFRKQFTVSEDMLRAYNFILVAEGINNQSSVKINNSFAAQNDAGFLPTVIPLDKNVLKGENLLEVQVNSSLTLMTIPQQNNLRFGRCYGGITGDIYILAVPDVMVFESNIISRFESLSKVSVKSILNLRSFEIGGDKKYSIKSVIIKPDGSEASASNPVEFTIGNFRSQNLNIESDIPAPVLWEPDNPALYTIKYIITDSAGKVTDEFSVETGFRNIQFKKDYVEINGRQVQLNGINYQQESFKYGSAIDYAETEHDLKMIKETGFNAVRIAGNCANPYVVNLCGKLGLFLFTELPFNNVAEKYLAKSSYTEKALTGITALITTYKNSPSIIAWGIGNNFDVTAPSSENYVRSAVETVSKNDTRPAYYTTYNINNDICAKYISLRGINLFGKDTVSFKNSIEELKNLDKQNKTGNTINFISDFGVRINNENHNGFTDSHSAEFQSKYLVSAYSILTNKFPAGFLSSYADFNTQRTYNYPMNANTFLNTSGIFTIYREQKQSAQFIKRILNKQDQPKILEGENAVANSYFFIIAGVALCIIFLAVFANVRRLKESLWRSLYRPANFYQIASEQMMISVTLNLMISFLISAGIGLFISSILYFYRENFFYDFIISNIFSSNGLKTLFSEITVTPWLSFTVFTVLNFLLQFLATLLVYFISIFISGKVYFKNLYTVSVWSSIHMLIFLPLGIIIINLGFESSQYLYLSLMFFAIMHFLYVLRFIRGINVILETPSFKTYLYALSVIVVLYGGVYAYLYFLTGTVDAIGLVKSYLAN